MKEILVRPEHLHRVTEYTNRVRELMHILDTTDSKDEWRKTGEARKKLDKEFWAYFIPRYKLTEPVRSLVETRIGEFFILNGTPAEIKKQTGMEKDDPMTKLHPYLPLELD